VGENTTMLSLGNFQDCDCDDTKVTNIFDGTNDKDASWSILTAAAIQSLRWHCCHHNDIDAAQD
jgi:hypothetical protein